MGSLALYIHWPFCLAKCPYCDFNSHVRDRIPQERFRGALRRELAWEAERLGRRRLTSIYFGGGTPSLMEPETVAELIADAARLFDPADDIEVTLEANPTSVEAERFAAFRSAGINRVSIGVQSLDPAALRLLGRQHSVAQAITALEAARAMFPRVSFDLIYARPGQTPEAWERELSQAFALAADHVSLYQLTIEPGTQFAVLHQRGAIVVPAEATAAALYRMTAATAQQHGFFAYEVSNYARPGSESRHNLAYWHYRDYAGIGPGAHGRITLPARVPRSQQPRGAAPGAIPRDARFAAHPEAPDVIATRRHRAPEVWAERVERNCHGTVEEVSLEPIERAREMLLMGLRLKNGVSAARFAARTGLALAAALEPSVLEQAISEGYVTWNDGCLAVTDEGRLRLDALLAAMLR